MDFPERDWKLFRALREVALDRFCARVLHESAAVIADPAKTHHARYLALFGLLRRRDRALADAFNTPRRSAALIQLMRMRALGLVTDDEFARFGPEIRHALREVPEWSGSPEL